MGAGAFASGVGIHGGTQQAGSAYQGARERGTKGYHNVSTHLEFNFEIDLAQYAYNTRRIWDVDEQAWAVRKRNVSMAALAQLFTCRHTRRCE